MTDLYLGIDVSFQKKRRLAIIGLAEEAGHLKVVPLTEFPSCLRGGGMEMLRRYKETARRQATEVGRFLKGFYEGKGYKPTVVMIDAPMAPPEAGRRAGTGPG